MLFAHLSFLSLLLLALLHDHCRLRMLFLKHQLFDMCIFRKQAAVQVIQHILRTLIAQLAVFHGCLDDDVLHGLRQCRIEITNTWYLLTQMLHCNLDGVVSMEGNIPGQKLIKHDTKRIDVHLIAWCFSPCCFRSQIVRTAQYRITLRQLYRIVRQRNSEIGNLYRTIILNQNILRLDIPVNPNANYHKGTVENPANLWKFREGDPNPDESRRVFPLADDIRNCFGGVKVLVTNDANAATIGEMIYGNAKGMRDFIMITLGTGLGSGFVANGEMIYGHDGFAGEFGHVIVERDGRECGCGRKGCLETYVSATGIKRTAFELMAKMSAPSKLRDIAFGDFDASMISAAAEQGDPIALEAFRFTGEMLGRALADVVTVTSPEAIFLFGGLSKAV